MPTRINVYLPVCPLLKNEFVDANIWFGVIPPSVILLSFSIVVIGVGLPVVPLVIRDDDDDEKWLLLLLFNERLLGICGLAAELVVVVVADDEGVLVEKIWLGEWRIEDDDG